MTTSETTNMAHLIDTGSYAVVGNVPVGQRPRFAAFTPDGKKLWVSSEIGGTVSIIDLATQAVEKTVQFEIAGVGRDAIQPVGLELTRDGATAFVALGPANRVAVINVRTGNVIKYILVGQRVWHLRLTPDEQLLFTTNGVSNDVTAIDVKALKAVKSIKVGRYPWGSPFGRRLEQRGAYRSKQGAG